MGSFEVMQNHPRTVQMLKGAFFLPFRFLALNFPGKAMVL